MSDPTLVGIVGTFDVSNFGDLLFPLLAERELADRLDRPEIVRYSYRQMPADLWPYEVRTLGRLSEDITDLDLLVVGGGHLVRFDKAIAPGYRPPENNLHHPTAYWLMPTLLGAIYGVPVAWNALGVSPHTPAWASKLLALALKSTAYVSVRDEPSCNELAKYSDTRVRLVPDTAFGIQRLLPKEPSNDFRDFSKLHQLTRPYVIVQPSPDLIPHARQITDALRRAQAAGCTILELPISPALGDRVDLLRLELTTVQPTSWPSPTLLSELISCAEAVVAQSLHLSIVSVACGVPVYRHKASLGTKYHALDGLSQLHSWDDSEELGDLLSRNIGATKPGTDVAERVAQLRSHWDTIADLSGRRDERGPARAAQLITECTHGLEAAAAEADAATSDLQATQTQAAQSISSLQRANEALQRSYETSRSWRITRPLRTVARLRELTRRNRTRAN
jgi:hypothetical protein